jgi:hypothetical protein
MAGFCISGAEPSDSATSVLLWPLGHLDVQEACLWFLCIGSKK